MNETLHPNPEIDSQNCEQIINKKLQQKLLPTKTF